MGDSTGRDLKVYRGGDSIPANAVDKILDLANPHGFYDQMYHRTADDRVREHVFGIYSPLSRLLNAEEIVASLNDF